MSRARSRFPGMSAGERIYSAVLHRDKRAEQELDPEVRRNLAPNGLRLVAANALQSSGDQIVNASTVLPWLFNALGVPVALTGLLVPIRESLSMLPQAFLTPLIVRVRFRKWVFISGALVQAASAGVIAGTAALGQGLVAGVVILVGLAAFALITRPLRGLTRAVVARLLREPFMVCLPEQHRLAAQASKTAAFAACRTGLHPLIHRLDFRKISDRSHERKSKKASETESPPAARLRGSLGCRYPCHQ